MLRKFTTAAAVAIAFTSVGASAETISASQLEQGNGSANGVTFAASGGALSYKTLNGKLGVGVGDTSSIGGMEIGDGESITATNSAGSFLFGGTTLVFLYSQDAGYGDTVNETAVLTANYANGGSKTYNIQRTGDSTVSVTDGSGQTVDNAPVKQVYGNSTSGPGLVSLGALFGYDPITSLIYSAGQNPTSCPAGAPCANYNDFAVADIDVPEPASIAMFGVGLVLLGFGVRRRRGNLG